LQIKAQGLLNAAKWIEEQYGASALTEVIRACSEPVRERYVSAIAINWHPMSEFIEFLEVAERVLGRSDGKIAEQIGAAGARANMKGVMVRFAFYVAKPEYLLQRVAGLWHQFNDEGEMKLLEVTDNTVRVEVSGVKTPHWLFCCVLTGWCREVAASVDMTKPHARHVECITRGGARCIWDIKGTRKSIPPAGPSSGSLPSAPGPVSSGKHRVPK
jgi:hypothetical protein